MPADAARRWLERWLRGEQGGIAAAALSGLLLPAEGAYRLGNAVRTLGYDTGVLPTRRAAVPTISVGNVAVGGAGKTPVASWIVDLLLARGRHPAILHGGYAEDEPELHRLWHPDVPVLAERDRVAAAGRAVAAGADVLVLDDAFQHRRLARDLDLVLIAAEDWTGRPRLLPRGPWREPPSALRRAHLLALTRKTADPDRTGRAAAELACRSGRPVLIIALRPAGWARVQPDGGAGAGAGAGTDVDTRAGTGSDVRADPGAGAPSPEAGAAKGAAAVLARTPGVLAVAGIAAPARFVENARQSGAVIRDVLVFPDHHRYAPGDVAKIRERAAGGPVITTEKDAVKLSSPGSALDLWVLKQTVVVESGLDALEARLDEVLS